jgi:lysophospholipase L1-like esterase
MSRPLLSLLSLVLSLLVAEALLRGPLRPELLQTRDADWQIRTRVLHARLHQPDPALIYTPRPGAVVEMDYGVVAVNDAGGRGPTPSARIAMLGDSLVWGELLAESDTISARLAGHLGEPVSNFGVTGYSTAQEAGWYVRVVRPEGPEVVVVVYCLNDMLMMSGPLHLYADRATRDAWIAERAWIEQAAPLRNESISRLWLTSRGDGIQLLAALSHAARWLRLFTLPGGYTDEFLLAAADPGRRAATASALADLGTAIRADGAEPVLVISPALYWWHRYQWGDLHRFIAQSGADAGFSVLDPPREGEPDDLRFPGDNLHYTPAGAEWIAARIAAFLRQTPAVSARLAQPGRTAR